MIHSANYDYVILTAKALASSAKPRVLDFGCGLGAVVDLGLAQGLDIVGADTFEGGYKNWRERVPAHLSDRIYQIDGHLPFPNDSFDVVISNQVFEHIPDPRTVLPEIRRVLKPGGVLLALFPVRETWYEGHVGLYFAHRLKRHPRILRAYLRLAHTLGFGLYRNGQSSSKWSDQKALILETMCFYHRRNEVESWIGDILGRPPQSWAADYVAYRLKTRVPLWIPAALRTAMYTLIAHVRVGLVLVAVVQDRTPLSPLGDHHLSPLPLPTKA